MSMSAEDLDAALDERRLELRLRWSQLAHAAGMDPGNLRRIRKGLVALTDFAARGLDTAAEWPPGTAMTYWIKGPERPVVGSEAWWEDLARKLPPEDFWEVVEHAKMLKAQIPKLLAQRLAEYTERNRTTHSSA